MFLLREFHGQRSLAGCRQWDHKELDTTERLTLWREKVRQFSELQISGRRPQAEDTCSPASSETTAERRVRTPSCPETRTSDQKWHQEGPRGEGGAGAVRCSAGMSTPTKREKDGLAENGQEARPRPSQRVLPEGPVRTQAALSPTRGGGCKLGAHQTGPSQALSRTAAECRRWAVTRRRV